MTTSRSEYLGGSDAAAALGISPWRSRYRLWCEKSGAESPPDLAENEWIYWGNALEPLVAEEFAKRVGLRVRRSSVIHRHSRYRFLAGHLDRLIPAERTFLECKTANAFDYRDWGRDEEGAAGVPAHYVAQCDHYMMLLRASHCYLAALIGGNQFRCYRIVRDEKREARLLAAELELWEMVKRGEPPPIESEADARHRWRAVQEGIGVAVSREVREKVVRLAAVAERRAEAEKEEKALRDAIFPLFEDRELLVESGESIARLTVFSRQQFKLDEFRKRHPKLAKKFTAIEASKRFKVLI